VCVCVCVCVCERSMTIRAWCSQLYACLSKQYDLVPIENN